MEPRLKTDDHVAPVESSLLQNSVRAAVIAGQSKRLTGPAGISH